MMAAPIIAGNRLDRMDNETVSTAPLQALYVRMLCSPLFCSRWRCLLPRRKVTILTHPGLLKVNQDPIGMQATRIETFGPRVNFSDVYGDPLARWEQEVWAKPLLYAPGQLYQYGFALALVNHGAVNATITARTDVLARAYPTYLPADSAAKFDSLELWSGLDAGDVVLGDAVSWTVAPSGVAVITLIPDC